MPEGKTTVPLNLTSISTSSLNLRHVRLTTRTKNNNTPINLHILRMKFVIQHYTNTSVPIILHIIVKYISGVKNDYRFDQINLYAYL